MNCFCACEQLRQTCSSLNGYPLAFDFIVVPALVLATSARQRPPAHGQLPEQHLPREGRHQVPLLNRLLCLALLDSLRQPSSQLDGSDWRNGNE